MLAVTFEGRITVLNARGEGFDVPVNHPRSELPDIFWWPDGTRFFAVGRLSPDSKTRLSVFAANDGALLESVDFDPVDLMPYDHDANQEVPRYVSHLESDRLARCWTHGRDSSSIRPRA
jgi:hypothetical protein